LKNHWTYSNRLSPRGQIAYKQAASMASVNPSLTNCRFYEEKYPEIDSFVVVNVSAP